MLTHKYFNELCKLNFLYLNLGVHHYFYSKNEGLTKDENILEYYTVI